MSRITSDQLYAFDRLQCASAGEWLTAGVDEVGRGPLAGPVVAAAVMFRPETPLLSVRDSKQLSASRRETLYTEIAASCEVGIGVVDEQTIDRLNIFQASRLAMRKAVEALSVQPGLLLIDGNAPIDTSIPQKTIVKGDAQSARIAAASIIAKVYRDRYMETLDQRYPEYGFKIHKGYPTPGHLECLKRLGPLPIHRKSFAPVRNCRVLLQVQHEA